MNASNNIQYIKQNCHICLHRHSCRHNFDKIFCPNGIYSNETNCKYWQLGKCLLCRNLYVSEGDWFQRGCEAWCFGGCKKFKRNWKATFKWWFKRKIVLNGQVLIKK